MNFGWVNFRITLVVLALVAWDAVAHAGPLDAAAVDKIVKEALKTWQVPGASLAIVQNDQVVYLKGHGVRELGSDKPVTPNTLFGIASLTKAFTATAMAILVDEGKMKWDDPVRKHVPFFRLADPLADENVTLRDLVSHRTGLSRHELLWLRAPWSQEETIRRLAFIKPAHSFRSRFEYNNIMYMAAGQAVASAAKSTWQDYVRQRIFMPLNMKGALFNKSALFKTPDHASPHHQEANARLQVIPWYDDDKQIRASGSIKASARHLGNWLRFQLGGGTFAGKRLLSARSLRETHTPQMVIRLQGLFRAAHPEATQMSYGLGWTIEDYKGQMCYTHTGGTQGFRSRVVLVPEARLGIVLLMNSDIGTSHASMHYAVTNDLLDQLLGLSRKDWNSYYAALVRKSHDEVLTRAAARQARRRKDTKPSRNLEAYAGTYTEPAYGKATIALENGGLVLQWSSFKNGLEHFHFNTFNVKGDPLFADEQAVFHLGADGEIATLQWLGVKFRKKK